MIVDGKSTPLSSSRRVAARARRRAPPRDRGPDPDERKDPRALGQHDVPDLRRWRSRSARGAAVQHGEPHDGVLRGSLAVHLGVWAFLQTIPTENSGVNIDLANLEATSMNAKTTETDDVPPPPEESDLGNSGGNEGQGAKMALAEGKAGKPDASRTDGHMRVKKTSDLPPALAREQAIEQARNAGFMGSISTLKGGIATLASTADFSNGFDGSDVYGPLFGSEGEGQGSFGGGVHDWGGPGGGCMAPRAARSAPATTARGYRRAQRGRLGWPRRWWPGHAQAQDGRPGWLPRRPTSEGDLDKAIIKRYIKRNVDKIAYCYEKQLLASPGLGGAMSVPVPDRSERHVQASNGSGFNGEVAAASRFIKSINFPAPKNAAACR